MDANYPKTAELSYQLKIRNLVLSGTVNNNRKILLGTLSEEVLIEVFEKILTILSLMKRM